MPDEFDEAHTIAVRDRAYSNGMTVHAYGSYVNPASPDFEERAVKALRIAKTLRCRIVRVWAGNREPREADDNTWNLVAKAFRQFALQAEYEGITLAMEAHCGTLCATAEGALRLIEQCGAPNLKINYQIYDPCEPDLERIIPLLGKHIANVHAQNYRVSCLENKKLEISGLEEGLVDYNHLLALLKEQNYRGYVEVEFLKGEFVSKEAMLESLKKDAEYLRTLTARYS